MILYPVILCGGSGTRLWPASRPSRPKQFLPLVGERSLFQETALRMSALKDGAGPIVVAGAGHVAAIQSQLAAVGLDGVVIVEPEGRDSAPAIAAAAAYIAEIDPKGVAAVVASDHHIADVAAFRASVEAGAAAAARGGRIVAFGVKPRHAATAYGYIQPGEVLPGLEGARALDRFVEKPDARTAADYVAAGYLWNSGNFVFAAADLLAELDVHAPEVARAARAALAEAPREGGVVRLGPAFRAATRISIDYAVMEKTGRAAVLPVDFAWSDLGAWDAVLAASPRDAQGCSVVGETIAVDLANSLVRNASGRLLAVVGLDGVAVVAEPDAVLVCALDASQSVKVVVDRLKAAHHPAADLPPEYAGDLASLRARFSTWLATAALPLWWSLGADHANGGFHEALDPAGVAVDRSRRVRVQARQAWSYLAAGTLGWPGPWRTAALQGLDRLQDAYRRPDGLYRRLVDAQGQAVDDTATLYDQTFVLLALAAAAKTLDEPARELEATALLDQLQTLRGVRGFVEVDGPSPSQSNPHMHLLEAALAWETVSSDPRWPALADEIVALALDRMIDPESGALREFFDADWRPAAGAPGRRIEPGHQFEWCWLLERWSRRRTNAAASVAARKLYAAGLRGVCPTRGLATNAMDDDLAVIDPSARLWPQTEWLKAALILDRPGDAARAGLALAAFLDRAVPGLWRDQMDAEGRFDHDPSPASSLYHIVCALQALIDPAAFAER